MEGLLHYDIFVRVYAEKPTASLIWQILPVTVKSRSVSTSYNKSSMRKMSQISSWVDIHFLVKSQRHHELWNCFTVTSGSGRTHHMTVQRARMKPNQTLLHMVILLLSCNENCFGENIWSRCLIIVQWNIPKITPRVEVQYVQSPFAYYCSGWSVPSFCGLLGLYFLPKVYRLNTS